METLEERIRRLVQEDVVIEPYDDRWPLSFEREKEHLRSCLPQELIRRIEHFGSTAVPGLAAKPIIDMLVEVTDLDATRNRIAPLLEAQGYDYLWRPTHGDDGAPFYAWFIKRDPATRIRTHHIHMVEDHFVDHLKTRLASTHPKDRVAYTREKTEFVARVTEQARRARDTI